MTASSSSSSCVAILISSISTSSSSSDDGIPVVVWANQERTRQSVDDPWKQTLEYYGVLGWLPLDAPRCFVDPIGAGVESPRGWSRVRILKGDEKFTPTSNSNSNKQQPCRDASLPDRICRWKLRSLTVSMSNDAGTQGLLQWWPLMPPWEDLHLYGNRNFSLISDPLTRRGRGGWFILSWIWKIPNSATRSRIPRTEFFRRSSSTESTARFFGGLWRRPLSRLGESGKNKLQILLLLGS
jgi:hypothetical protein